MVFHRASLDGGGPSLEDIGSDYLFRAVADRTAQAAQPVRSSVST
jgi:hypothetical protein